MPSKQNKMRADLDFFENVVENLPQTVYETNAQGILIYVNPWGLQEFGYGPEDLNKISVMDTLIPEDRKRCQANIQKIIKGISGESHEYQALRKDGSIFPVIIFSRVLTQNGSYTGLQGVIINISDRYEKEQLLRESEARYQNLVENNPNGIIVHQDGKIIFANTRAAYIMGGDSVSDVMGKMILDHIHPDDREVAIQRIQKIMENKEKHLPPAEERFIRKDGTCINVEVHSIPFIYNDRPAVQVVFSDITEKKQLAREKEELQNQLNHSQKLEAVGTLAGGIAHDFNNLLTVIIANTELIKLKENKNRSDDLDTILHAARTAATLTKRLLSFSRKQTPDREYFRADKIMSDMRAILSRLLPENFTLNLKLGAPETTIFASKSEMEHILINLVVNARDAMREGGDIDISSSEVEINGTELATVPVIFSGSYYQIIVQDYGCGIDKNIQKHLFEPFFSTKEVGKGTGLGLSTVYGIVRRHNGGIEIESEVGIGTCFKIYIPMSTSEEPAISSGKPQFTASQDKRCVLLIEDDIDVRIISRQMLEDQGYQVYSACDIDEAFALFERHKNDIDLIVSDVRLPDGTGLEFADIVQHQHKTLPILFISGYRQLDGTDMQKKDYRRGFLAKPFDHSSLIQAINSITVN